MKALISPLKLLILTALVAASFTPAFAKAKDWDTENIDVLSKEFKMVIEMAFYLYEEDSEINYEKEPEIKCDYGFLNHALDANSGKLGSFIADEDGEITKESIDEKVYVSDAEDEVSDEVVITLTSDEYQCLLGSQGFEI